MKEHTKIYMAAMGFDATDFIPCEVCQSKAVDIHHIDARGMGGGKAANTIENLMAVCRKCHLEYGDIEHLKDQLRTIHTHWMEVQGVKPKQQNDEH
jgi:hypothetical protein